jgi:biopolymer transport protein TolQ
MQPVATISIVTLFLDADIVVKGVLLLLLVASVWSWAIILDKLWRLGAVSRSARAHEARAAAAGSPAELWPPSARGVDLVETFAIGDMIPAVRDLEARSR